jgi:hypothetical protein
MLILALAYSLGCLGNCLADEAKFRALLTEDAVNIFKALEGKWNIYKEDHSGKSLFGKVSVIRLESGLLLLDTVYTSGDPGNRKVYAPSIIRYEAERDRYLKYYYSASATGSTTREPVYSSRLARLDGGYSFDWRCSVEENDFRMEIAKETVVIVGPRYPDVKVWWERIDAN